MNQPIAWAYKAEIAKIVDGDTIDVTIRWDIGFKITCETYQRLRLARINAPEVRGPQRPDGLKAKTWLTEQTPIGSTIWVETYKDDAFGRYIANLYNEYDECINDLMVEQGHAEYKQY